MSELPPDYDAIARDRARMERRRREKEQGRREVEEQWRVTGWGAVGVDWCEMCGNRFEGVAYVSDSPWGRSYNCPKCVGAKLRHTTEPRPCEVCGREFVWVGGWDERLVKKPRPRRHICSDVCWREHRNRRRRVQHPERTCATCGRSFTPARADAVYCGHACRQRAHRART